MKVVHRVESSRGFSLVQLIIGFLLASILVIVFALAIRGMMRSQEFDQEANRLIERSHALESLLREDFSAAVRLDPSTSSQGGVNWTPTPDGGGNQTLQLFTGDLGFSAPVATLLNAGPFSLATINATNFLGIPEAQQTYLLLRQALQQSPPRPSLTIGNPENRFLIPGTDYSATSSPNSITVQIDQGQSDIIDILRGQSLPIRLSIPREVQYVFNSGSQTLSRVTAPIVGRPPNPQTDSSIISNGITQFSLAFDFQNFDNESRLIVPNRGVRLSSPLEEFYGDPLAPWNDCPSNNPPANCQRCFQGVNINGFNCANWSHTRTVFVQYEIQSENELSFGRESQDFESGVRVQNNRLSYRREITFPLTGFRGGGVEDVGGIVNLTCRTPRAHYCSPQRTCDLEFTSPDRNSLFWEGYKAGSSWCECATNAGGQIRLDFETNPHNHGVGSVKLQHCARAMRNNTSVSWGYSPGAHHPVHYLAVRCIQPSLNPDGSVAVRPVEGWTLASRGYNTFQAQQISVPQQTPWTIPELPNPPAGSEPLVEGVQDFNISCDNYAGCIEAARDASALGAGVWGGINVWQQTCECRNHQVDFLGRYTRSIEAHIRRWDLVCNRDADFTQSGQTLRCPNSARALPTGTRSFDPEPDRSTNGNPSPASPETWNYEYIPYHAGDDPQGLTPEDLQVCICLRGAANDILPWAGNAVRVVGPSNNPWRLHQNIDWRHFPLGPDPTGSTGPQPYGNRRVFHEDHGNIDCTAIMRGWWTNTAGPMHCVASNNDFTVNSFTNSMNALGRGAWVTSNPGIENYRNYCSNRCSIPGANGTTRQETRLFTTNSSSVNASDPNGLPTWCGGQTPGGSQGGGGGNGG